jgi:hypothetical protein
MAKITLEYDARNPIAKKTLAYILSIGFSEVKPRKTGLEEAFEDIEKGRITTIHTPKNWKSKHNAIPENQTE